MDGGPPLVAGRRRTILFSLAERAAQVVPAKHPHTPGSYGPRSHLQRSLLPFQSSQRRLRNISRGRGQSGDRLPAGDLRFAHPENRPMGRVRHAARGPAHSKLSGEYSGAHIIHAVCALAHPALLDRGTGVARHSIAISHLERGSRDVAGENQLQPLPVARAVFLQSGSATRLPTAPWYRVGLSFLLPYRTTCIANAGQKNHGSAAQDFRHRLGYVRSRAVLSEIDSGP